MVALERLLLSGGLPVVGKVRISGAKNAALPIIAGSILAEGQVRLENVPDIEDVRNMLEIASELGYRVLRGERNALSLEALGGQACSISGGLARKLRASNLFLGALLARYGAAEIPMPGGCEIGSRPMDLHLKGLVALGAQIEVKGGSILARGKLKGSEVYLDFPSVGATENIMLAATTAAGQTVISNAAREPEIVDLANFLNALGARVRGAGTGVIKVDGVKGLGNTEYPIIPDRIEAGTFMLASALTRGNLFLEPVIIPHLQPVIAKLREVGAEVEEEGNGLRVVGAPHFKAINLKTMPYPGFPTDLQSMMLVLLSLARGTSIVVETIYDNRFQVVPELRRMGARIDLEGQSAVVIGVRKLQGGQVQATDLRSGAALVLAGLVAEGWTEVSELEVIDRGYENLEGKLKSVGASLHRVGRKGIERLGAVKASGGSQE